MTDSNPEHPQFLVHEVFRSLLSKLTHIFNKNINQIPTTLQQDCVACFEELKIFLELSSYFLKDQLNSKDYHTFIQLKNKFYYHKQNYQLDWELLKTTSYEEFAPLYQKYNVYETELRELNLKKLSAEELKQQPDSDEILWARVPDERFYAYETLLELDAFFGVSLISNINATNSFLFFRSPQRLSEEEKNFVNFQKFLKKPVLKIDFDLFQKEIKPFASQIGFVNEIPKASTVTSFGTNLDSQSQLEKETNWASQLLEFETLMLEKSVYSLHYFQSRIRKEFFSKKLFDKENFAKQQKSDFKNQEKNGIDFVDTILTERLQASSRANYLIDLKNKTADIGKTQADYLQKKDSSLPLPRKQFVRSYLEILKIQRLPFLDSILEIHEFLIRERNRILKELEDQNPQVFANFKTFLEIQNSPEFLNWKTWNVLNNAVFLNISFCPLYLNQEFELLNTCFSGSFVDNPFQKSKNRLSLYYVLSHHQKTFKSLLQLSPYDGDRYVSFKEKVKAYRHFIKTGTLVSKPGFFWELFSDVLGFFGMNLITSLKLFVIWMGKKLT